MVRKLILLAVALGMAGCGGDRGSPRPSETSPVTEQGGIPYRYAAVQLGSFSDSGNAARFRDSLDKAGWAAQVRPARRGRWRVQVAPTRQLAYIQVLKDALEKARHDSGIRVVYDSGDAPHSRLAGFTRVNYGAHGMAARVRWAFSPDRRAIIVMEDPASVENDPLPNGVFFASEAVLRSVQLDSVWDAAPDPGWQRLAVGRAYLIRDRTSSDSMADSARAAQLAALADSLNLSERGLRAAAFPASGMSPLLGWAQPAMVQLDSITEPLASRTRYPVAAGWRIGWSANGDRILAGKPPAHPRDNTPSSQWISIDPESGNSQAVSGDPDRSQVPWIYGPLLDVSVPVRDNATVVIPTGEGTITSRDGWIRLDGRMFGPGIALAATAGGHYLVALVPNASAEPGEASDMLVVYTILH
jgi:hypothetical protein